MVKLDSGGRLQYIQCQQSREDPWFVQRMYYPEDINYPENINCARYREFPLFKCEG